MSNTKIPTAEEVMQNHLDPHDCLRVSKCYNMTLDAMIEFAKLHVEAALKAAGENARIKANTQQGGSMFTDDFEVVKESILNSYPLDQIK